MWYNGPNLSEGQNGDIRVSWFGNRRSAMLSTISKDLSSFRSREIFSAHDRNDHAEPVILETKSGILLSAFCIHNSPLMVRRITSIQTLNFPFAPGTIDSGTCTYPQIFQSSSGKLYIFYRKGRDDDPETRDLAVVTSIDDGQNWTQPRIIVKAPDKHWVYALIRQDNNNINFGISLGLYDLATGNISDVHIFIADENLVSGTSVSGLDIAFPVMPSESTIVLETKHSSDDRIWDYRFLEKNEHFLLLVSDSHLGELPALSVVQVGADASVELLELVNVARAHYPCGAVFGQTHRDIISSEPISSAQDAQYAKLTAIRLNEEGSAVESVQPLFGSEGARYCRPEFHQTSTRGLVTFLDIASYDSHLNFSARLMLGIIPMSGEVHSE
jgi:hypothetical protein